MNTGYTAPPDVLQGLSVELSRLAETARKTTVEVRNGSRGAGAGTVRDETGLVVTNAHVVSGVGGGRGGRLTVAVDGADEFGAEILENDRARDLALLRLEEPPRGLSPARFGDSDSLRPGELVFAVGHPRGRLGAVTAGVVSDRPRGRGAGGMSYIRSDVDLAPGNSGGPLLNASGEVVGINAMISGSAALSIPGNEVERWLAGEAGRPRRLGVRFAVAPGAGLVISAVEAGSPAERAGLAVGDVLLAADGSPLRGAGSLRASLARAASHAEGTVRLKVRRGAGISVVEADLKAQPPERAA